MIARCSQRSMIHLAYRGTGTVGLGYSTGTVGPLERLDTVVLAS